MLLKDKNVFITGGSRGIGKAAIIELVKNGANIAFTYVSNEEGAKDTVKIAKEINQNVKIVYYRLDVKNSKEVDQIADRAIGDFGHIDVVINNAGILKDGPIHFMSDISEDEVIQTHLTGTFYVCRGLFK